MDKPPTLAGDEKQRSYQEFLTTIRNKFGLQQGANASKPAVTVSFPILGPPPNGYKLRTAPPPGFSTAHSAKQQSNIIDIPLLRNGYKKTIEPALPRKESEASSRANLNRETDGAGDVAFDIPLLRRQRNLESVEQPQKSDLINLRQDVARLKITEDVKEPIVDIDLTVALNSKVEPSTSSRALASRANPAEHFEIPFIECDRPLRSLNIIQPDGASNEQTSKLTRKAPKGKPSAFGRVLTLHYKSKSPLPKIAHGFESKHKIMAFQFDKKSPDDIVTASLNKIPRRV